MRRRHCLRTTSTPALPPLPAGIWVTVERTNPANPVRNMRLLMPGVDASEEASGDVTRRPFMPQLKQFVSRFSAIRFMVRDQPGG